MMQAESVDQGSETPGRKARFGKTRVGIAIFLCPVLLLTVIASTAVRFTGGRILDGSSFSSYASSAVSVPEVTDAVGSAASDKTLDLVDPDHRLTEKRRGQIKESISDSMRSEMARGLAVSIFSAAHNDFIATAERDDLTGSEIFKVDLLPLVYVALADLSQKKMIPAKIAPLSDPPPDSAALGKTLSKALGRKVPANAGTVKVIEPKKDGSKSAFVQVHDILGAYHNGVNAALLVGIVLLVAVVFLFVRRRVGVIVGSAVVLTGSLVPWIALSQVPSRVAEAIDDEKGSAIARAFLSPLTDDVRSRLLIVMILAVLAIVVASLWSRLPFGRSKATA